MFLIVFLLLLLLLSWLLFSVIEIKVDTRIPEIIAQWISIGKVSLVYEKEAWWLKIQVLFYHKKWLMEQLIEKKGKRKKNISLKPKKKRQPVEKQLQKSLKLVRSFKITAWQIAIDTGDYALNARLYAFNFLPTTQRDVRVNFSDENFVALKIQTSPWRILYYLIK